MSVTLWVSHQDLGKKKKFHTCLIILPVQLWSFRFNLTGCRTSGKRRLSINTDIHSGSLSHAQPPTARLTLVPACATVVLPLRVVSGSRDATLRVWDIETGQCLHVLMGHVAAVRCVQYDGRRVVSGAYDFMVKVWDPETETCLHTLQGHTNRVYSLQVSTVGQEEAENRLVHK